MRALITVFFVSLFFSDAIASEKLEKYTEIFLQMRGIGHQTKEKKGLVPNDMYFTDRKKSHLFLYKPIVDQYNELSANKTDKIKNIPYLLLLNYYTEKLSDFVLSEDKSSSLSMSSPFWDSRIQKIDNKKFQEFEQIANVNDKIPLNQQIEIVLKGMSHSFQELSQINLENFAKFGSGDLINEIAKKMEEREKEEKYKEYWEQIKLFVNNYFVVTKQQEENKNKPDDLFEKEFVSLFEPSTDAFSSIKLHVYLKKEVHEFFPEDEILRRRNRLLLSFFADTVSEYPKKAEDWKEKDYKKAVNDITVVGLFNYLGRNVHCVTGQSDAIMITSSQLQNPLKLFFEKKYPDIKLSKEKHDDSSSLKLFHKLVNDQLSGFIGSFKEEALFSYVMAIIAGYGDHESTAVSRYYKMLLSPLIGLDAGTGGSQHINMGNDLQYFRKESDLVKALAFFMFATTPNRIADALTKQLVASKNAFEVNHLLANFSMWERKPQALLDRPLSEFKDEIKGMKYFLQLKEEFDLWKPKKDDYIRCKHLFEEVIKNKLKEFCDKHMFIPGYTNSYNIKIYHDISKKKATDEDVRLNKIKIQENFIKPVAEELSLKEKNIGSLSEENFFSKMLKKFFEQGAEQYHKNMMKNINWEHDYTLKEEYEKRLLPRALSIISDLFPEYETHPIFDKTTIYQLLSAKTIGDFMGAVNGWKKSIGISKPFTKIDDQEIKRILSRYEGQEKIIESIIEIDSAILSKKIEYDPFEDYNKFDFNQLEQQLKNIKLQNASSSDNLIKLIKKFLEKYVNGNNQATVDFFKNFKKELNNWEESLSPEEKAKVVTTIDKIRASLPKPVLSVSAQKKEYTVAEIQNATIDIENKNTPRDHKIDSNMMWDYLKEKHPEIKKLSEIVDRHIAGEKISPIVVAVAKNTLSSFCGKILNYDPESNIVKGFGENKMYAAYKLLHDFELVQGNSMFFPKLNQSIKYAKFVLQQFEETNKIMEGYQGVVKKNSEQLKESIANSSKKPQSNSSMYFISSLKEKILKSSSWDEKIESSNQLLAFMLRGAGLESGTKNLYQPNAKETEEVMEALNSAVVALSKDKNDKYRGPDCLEKAANYARWNDIEYDERLKEPNLNALDEYGPLEEYEKAHIKNVWGIVRNKHDEILNTEIKGNFTDKNKEIPELYRIIQKAKYEYLDDTL